MIDCLSTTSVSLFMRHERKPQAMRTAGTRKTSSSHHTQPASGINHTLSTMMSARTAAEKMIHLTISATKKIQWCRSVYRIFSLAPICCFRYSTLTGPPSRSCRRQPTTKVGRRNAARAAGDGGPARRTGVYWGTNATATRGYTRDASLIPHSPIPVSYTHLRAHETDSYLVCRLL